MKLLTYTEKAHELPVWSTRSLAMIQSKELYKLLLETEEQPNEPAYIANGESNDKKKIHKLLKYSYEKEVSNIKDIWP